MAVLFVAAAGPELAWARSAFQGECGGVVRCTFVFYFISVGSLGLCSQLQLNTLLFFEVLPSNRDRQHV